MTTLITGATGFLGSVVARTIPASQRTAKRAMDLRMRAAVLEYWAGLVPDRVIHLAFPGSQGISTAVETPFSLASNCLRIDTNVIEACARQGVEHLVCVGSVCEYPEWHDAMGRSQMSEQSLFDGAPEPTNAPYGHAKRMQLALLDAARRQYGLKWCHLILDNLYGPGDRSAHVIPSLIQRCLAAKAAGAEYYEIWGDAGVSREFVYVDDAAEAIVRAHQQKAEGVINIVSGVSVTMGELALRIADACDYQGEFRFIQKPTGQRERWFSNQLARQTLDWSPSTSLEQGLRATVAWWRQQKGL